MNKVFKKDDLKSRFEALCLEVNRLRMQLNDANDVIMGYYDAYKRYPDGTMMTFVVNKHPAHHYIEKWGIR